MDTTTTTIIIIIIAAVAVDVGVINVIFVVIIFFFSVNFSAGTLFCGSFRDREGKFCQKRENSILVAFELSQNLSDHVL